MQRAAIEPPGIGRIRQVADTVEQSQKGPDIGMRSAVQSCLSYGDLEQL